MKKMFLSVLVVGCALYSNAFCEEGTVPDLYQKDKAVGFANAEFLYWTVDEGGLDYALKQSSPPARDIVAARGHAEKATFHWDPGFRVALGYFNAPKYWEVFGQFTWMRNKGSDHANKPSPLTVYLNATWPTGLLHALSSASSHIHLSYNIADLLASRVFIPNPHLRLRLVGGLTGGWINQHWNIHYTDVSEHISKLSNKWKFWGGGFRLGLNLDWYLGADFYLTGKSSVATLIGKYRNESTSYTTESPAGELGNSHFDDWRGVVNLQFLLGPSWQMPLSFGRIEIFAGYELGNWFNLQEFNRSFLGSVSTDIETIKSTHLLTLHGLNVRLTLNF
ncbi:MAG: Lpg1974 family pore-forming outer membrane protein [Chlamydiota bacterium]